MGGKIDLGETIKESDEYGSGDGYDLSIGWSDIVGIAPENIRKLLTNPVSWLSGIVVTWTLNLWSEVLGYIEGMFDTLEEIPEVAIYDPIVGAFSPIGGMIQGLWRGFGTMAFEIAEPAGPFAPFVVVAIWAVTGMLGMSLVYFVMGFLGTYLPLNSLPVVRRVL